MPLDIEVGQSRSRNLWLKPLLGFLLILAAQADPRRTRQGETEMTATITLDPDPPAKGDKVKVCYTGKLPQTLRYRFKVGGVWSDWIDINCTVANGGCVSVDVPDGASRMQVEDPSGGAAVRDVPVT